MEPGRNNLNCKSVPAQPSVLDGLKAFVESVVDERLQKVGLLQKRLDPRGLRLARGMELRQVADVCGVSAAQISRIERGLIHNPAPCTLNRIARALGVAESVYRESVAIICRC